MDASAITLIGITFFAAMINGGLGYGFSSTTVPIALIFLTNRILNPAIVLIEIVINSYVLLLHAKSLFNILMRVIPIILGLIPGIILGSYFLSSVHPGWIKFFTFALLLPLILAQAAGIRRPVQAETALGLPFGACIGFFYSVTTVSGPPLAVLLNNQGLIKKDFRAAMGVIRLFLSSLTASAYYYLGLYQPESTAVLWTMVPSVIIGIPLGTFIIRRVNPETFRRICMSFDAWFVGFGLSRVLIELGLMKSPFAYSILALALLIDGYLLYRYFMKREAMIVDQPSLPNIQ